MVSHLLSLSIIYTIRSICGLGLATLFFYYSNPGNIPKYSTRPVPSRYNSLEPGDKEAFLVVGWVVASLALIRLAQAIYTLRLVRMFRARKPRRHIFAGGFLKGSRRLGFALAIIDLVDLTFFPVTTACGFYALLIYCHPDTADFYKGERASSRDQPMTLDG